MDDEEGIIKNKKTTNQNGTWWATFAGLHKKNQT